ncbi:MFS transporter [Streptomyces sp. RB6PN25]|uniref:MFS transporter n=1 Tax=Streptomyces humicola TaxID=2953240 RepID=A0ABT1PW09_9ACTN|nr:MFS transporter [Streptomyces humicola]MCQ4080752.1 MFS transporter [Streptomyces humicola]
MAPTATQAGSGHAARPRQRTGITVAIVLVAAFMQLIDVSIVNVAVASIQQGLGATDTQIQWVLAGYTLAFAVLLVAGGRLGDRLGRRRMFLVGMAGFTLASLLCGAATSPAILVGSRLVQGLAAALMYPQVYSVIQVAVSPKQRGAVLGALGGVIGLAAITGPLVGGLLINVNLFGWTWRPIFLVNVPIGVLTIMFALRFLPESRSEEPHAIDWLGVALVTLGVGLLVYPLVQGRETGWPEWMFGMLAAGATALLVFCIYESYRERTGRTPLVRMSLFAGRGFSGGLILIIVFYGAFLPFFLVFSLYVQVGLGYSALAAGVTLVPYALGSGAGSGLSIALAPRMGRTILHIGLALLIAGSCGIAWTVHRVGSHLHGVQLLPSLVVAGLGFGLTVTPLVTLILAKVPVHHAGSASGVLTTAQQFGSAGGIAVLGTVFFGLLGAHADTITHAQTPALTRQITPLATTGQPAPQVVAGYLTCFHDRANEKDSSVVPASCQDPHPEPTAVENVLDTYVDQAEREDFAWSAEHTVYVQIGLFAVCFLLVSTLPKVRGKELAEFEKQAQDAVIIG